MDFEKNKRLSSCAEINSRDIVDFLASIGWQPTQIKGDNYWYISPLRFERTPSFKVNRKLNRWYDFGTGEGSTLVDFGTRYFNCTIRELMQKLSGPFSNTENVPRKSFTDQPIAETWIEIKNISNLQSNPLIHYLQGRRISLNVAQKFCGQADFRIGNKNYYAICFRNNLGGYELRNKYFKGSSSPKDITFLSNNCPGEIAVFEGFFDFLSWFTIFNKGLQPSTDFLILNSTSFFQKSMTTMEKYGAIHLFLDNDPEGNRLTSLAIKKSTAYIDQRILYPEHKDIADFLCNRRQHIV